MFLFTEEHRQKIESQSAQMISEFHSELDSKKIYIAELEQRIEEFTLPTEGHDHVIIQIQLKFWLAIKTEACHMKHTFYIIDGSMKERALQKTVSVLIQKKQGKLMLIIKLIITVLKCKLVIFF